MPCRFDSRHQRKHRFTNTDLIYDHTSRPVPCTLIRGDDIGPEVVAIIEAMNAPFPGKNSQVNSVRSKTMVIPFPKPRLRAAKLALTGPLTTPTSEGFRSINVRIREELNLFAIAGHNIANPTTLLLASAMRLDHGDLNLLGDQ